MAFDKNKEIDQLREKCLNKVAHSHNHELQKLNSKLDYLQRDFLTFNTPKTNGENESNKLVESYILLSERMRKNANLPQKLT
jgi:hypothetical protein